MMRVLCELGFVLSYNPVPDTLSKVQARSTIEDAH